MPLAPAFSETPSAAATTAPALIPDDQLQELNARRAKINPDDPDARLALARWCKERELWSPMAELAREVLTLDSANATQQKVAFNFLRDFDEKVPLPETPLPAAAAHLQADLKTRFAHDFATRSTRHFLIVYDTPEVFAGARVASLEKAYDAFFYWFNLKKLHPALLDQRLVVILFKDRADYLAYAKAIDGGDMAWSAGYYSQRTNRTAFFDDATDPQSARAAEGVDKLRAILKDLSAEIDEARRVGDAAKVSTLTAERNQLAAETLKAATQLENLLAQRNTSKTVHEACHQLAFNTGIQKRLVDYPLWLTEGIACSFEAEGPFGARGPGIVNYGRVNVFKDALKSETQLPLATLLAPPAAQLDEKQLGLYYAQGWALTHYLYRYRRAAFEQYLTAYLAQPAAQAVPAELRQKLFTTAFGDDRSVLEKQYETYIKDLPAKAP